MSKKKKQSADQPASSSSGSHHGPNRANLEAEGTEPWADRNPLPMVLVVALAILFFAGDLYLMANRGDFDPRVYQPHPDYEDLARYWPVDPVVEFVKRGRKVYDNCVACHQPNGMGLPGQFPPLAGSDWVRVENPARIIRLVLSGVQGPITVNSQSFNNAMPPWGPVLKDEDIAAVVTYIRNEWGNKGSAVTPEQVAAIRKELGDRPPWSPDDLLKVPLQ
jgi:mono/diheme cytochrome c family protein